MWRREALPCEDCGSDSSSAAHSCPMPPNDGQWSADRRPAVKPLAQYGWRRVLWQVTRTNVGPSPDELYEFGLHSRIRRAAPDAYQIGVIGLVGWTTVTAALGSICSAIRGDRILAIDVDPN
jgi:hypothetical protein